MEKCCLGCCTCVPQLGSVVPHCQLGRPGWLDNPSLPGGLPSQHSLLHSEASRLGSLVRRCRLGQPGWLDNRWVAFTVASLIVAFLDTLPMSMTPLFRSIVYMLGNVCIHSCLAALAFKCHSAVLLYSLRYLTSCRLAHNHSRSSLVIVAVMPKIPMKYRAPSAWPMPKRGKVRANLKKPAAATKRANKKASNVPYTRVKGVRTKFYKERVR